MGYRTRLDLDAARGRLFHSNSRVAVVDPPGVGPRAVAAHRLCSTSRVSTRRKFLSKCVDLVVVCYGRAGPRWLELLERSGRSIPIQIFNDDDTEVPLDHPINPLNASVETRAEIIAFPWMCGFYVRLLHCAEFPRTRAPLDVQYMVVGGATCRRQCASQCRTVLGMPACGL